jgi:hypothetical protein
MSRRSLGRWLLASTLASALATVTLGLGACNTPFIPIPPPSDPAFKPIAMVDALGEPHTVWETSGGPNATMAGARVFVFNRNLGEGVITRAGADGAYVAAPLEGKLGDPIELFYETAKSERSPGICRVLQDGVAHNPCP